jgi:uncharacterized protein
MQAPAWCAIVLSLAALTACAPDTRGQRLADCAGISAPPLTAAVSDYANMMTAENERALAGRIARYAATTDHQAAIVTIDTLGGRTVETVTTCLFNTWGIGDADRDDGVLILVSRDDRAVRVELGEGFGNRDGDPRALAVVNAMTAQFAIGDYAAGLDSGLSVLERQLP